LTGYGNESSVNELKLFTQQFDKEDPNWLSTSIRTLELADEAALLNFGFAKEKTISDFEVGRFHTSSGANYPLDYKFSSLNIETNP
jgi:hypothetical protein